MEHQSYVVVMCAYHMFRKPFDFLRKVGHIIITISPKGYTLKEIANIHINWDQIVRRLLAKTKDRT